MMPRALPVAAAVLFAAAALVSACTHSPGGRAAGSGDERRLEPEPGAPVVVAARAVCHLIADNPDSAVAKVTGADGAPSVVVDGRAYWFFGDTVRTGPGGRQDVIPAALATSTDTDGSDCVRLDFKKAGGLAQPMFPRLEETTAWPDGILPLDDGSIVFYMVKVTRESPFAWHVSSVGLGRMDARSLEGTRTVEAIWDERSGFRARVAGVRSPVRHGDDVVVYIRTDDGANYVAKAPLSRIGERDAYVYWDGAQWSPRPQDAQPMWPVSRESGFPADNGVSVTFDKRSGRWLAIYNGDLATIDARTAPDPWGPWSEPVTWLDCRPLSGAAYPFCYSAEIHRELSQDGATAYVTFSGQKPYDVSLVELHFGVAIHEWRAAGGDLRYAAASPGRDYTDTGVAFYASDRPGPGLAPVFAADDGTYTLDAGDGEPAFYTYAAAPSAGLVLTQPVFRYSNGGHEALDAGSRPGWQRGEVAFYAACATPSENTGCTP